MVYGSTVYLWIGLIDRLKGVSMDTYEKWLEAEIKMSAKDKDTVNTLLNRVSRIIGKYTEGKSTMIGESGVPSSLKLVESHINDAKNWMELVHVDVESARVSEEVKKCFKEE